MYVAPVLSHASQYHALLLVGIFVLLALPPASSLQQSSSSTFQTISHGKLIAVCISFCPASIYAHSATWHRAWAVAGPAEEFGWVGLPPHPGREAVYQSTPSELSGVATDSP